MGNIADILWICAIAGTAFFFLRILLSMIFGVDSDLGGMIGGLADDGPAETDFQFVSLYTVFTFFMMFGWSGLAAQEQFGLDVVTTTLIAIVVGLGCMVVVAYLLSLFRKLTSPGDTFAVAQLIGQRGSTYERIPAGGTGVIHVTFNGLLREVPARASDTQETIESFTDVEVCGLAEEGVVVVRPVRS